MNKAEAIRTLLATTELSTKEIAAEVRCGDSYVRNVQQRMLGGGLTDADRNWRLRNPDRCREHKRAYFSRRY